MINEVIKITDDAVKRIIEIQNKDRNRGKFLRIKVLGGGCSGFQYSFDLDDKFDDSDLVISQEQKIIAAVDKTSLELLKGCSLDFVSNLGGAYFKIENPNATANCGCGNSFAI